MPLDFDSVMARVLPRAGAAELARIKPTIGSSTLRNAVRVIVDERLGQVRLFIPHYWAEFYHDGRDSVNPLVARKIVYFANPEDDPRAPTPERAAQRRRLTREEFYDGLAENARRKAAGQPPYMFVVDRTGPAPAHPFFDLAAQTASESVGPIIAEAFDDLVQESLSERETRPERKSASVRL
jgi:hypothetical protein